MADSRTQHPDPNTQDYGVEGGANQTVRCECEGVKESSEAMHVFLVSMTYG